MFNFLQNAMNLSGKTLVPASDTVLHGSPNTILQNLMRCSADRLLYYGEWAVVIYNTKEVAIIKSK